MTCDELRRAAAGLAALEPGDPERQAAFAHARACPRCAAALREGERLIALLEALPPEPAPHPATLRRAAAPVIEDLPRVAPRVVLPLAAAAAALLVVVAARARSDAPRDWVAAGALLIAAAGVAALAARGWAAALAAAALALLFAVGGGADGPLSAGVGLRCAVTELAAAALPVLAALAVWRRARTTPGRLAAAAAAGALAGQAALEVACHAPPAAVHRVVFHLGAVVAAFAVAAAAAAVVRARAERAGAVAGR